MTSFRVDSITCFGISIRTMVNRSRQGQISRVVYRDRLMQRNPIHIPFFASSISAIVEGQESNAARQWHQRLFSIEKEAKGERPLLQ
jgi:hypothetical protein